LFIITDYDVRIIVTNTSVDLLLLLLFRCLFISPFSPVLLLNQRRSQPLRLPVSDCSTFRIMCDVPSIAVFFIKSTDCFPGMASNFSFKPCVTIPVDHIITGIIIHFMFHIRCIYIHKLWHFSFFSASFCTIFLSFGVATSINMHGFSFPFLIIIYDLYAIFTLLLLLLLVLYLGEEFI